MLKILNDGRLVEFQRVRKNGGGEDAQFETDKFKTLIIFKTQL